MAVSKATRKVYRKRVAKSTCRKARSCRKARGCKMTKSGKRKAYCRKTRNHKK